MSGANAWLRGAAGDATRRARARCGSCAACSSRARTPTGRSPPRRPGSSRATARWRWRLAYGTVQRRATLDHVAAQLVRRPLGRARAGRARRDAARAVPAAVPRAGRRARRRRTRASSSPSATSRGGAGLVNAVLRRAGARGPGAARGAATTRPRTRPRCCTRCPGGWPSCGGASSAPTRRARCCARSTSPPSRRSGSTRWSRRSSEVRRGAAGAGSPRRRGSPEGLVLDGPFDAHGSELWRDGAIMPQSRASMLVSRGARAASPGERVLDLCAAPGGKTTHLAALIEDAGRGRGGRAPPGRAGGARAHVRADARRAASRCEVGDAAESRGRTAVRPGARRPAVQRARHAPVAARSALARRARGDRRAGGAAGADPRRGRRRDPRRAARSCTRSARSPARESEDVVERVPARATPSFASWSGSRRSCSRTATAPTASSSPGCAAARERYESRAVVNLRLA